MLTLDLVTLRLFLAAARERSMHKAAQRESIATSAISRRINDLELALGLRLLRRQPGGVELTPAGRIVADFAAQILLQTRDLTAELEGFLEGVRGELRLWASSAAVSGRFSTVLRGFLQRHPGVELRFHESQSLPSARALRDGLIDLAITADSIPLDGLEAEPFHADPMWVVTPRGHPLLAGCAEDTAVPFAEICRYELLSLYEGGPIDALITRALAEQHSRRARPIQLSRVESLRRFVEQGFGIGVLRRSAIRPYLDLMAIAGAPIADDWAQRRLAIVHRGEATLAPVPRLMLAHLREAAEG